MIKDGIIEERRERMEEESPYVWEIFGGSDTNRVMKKSTNFYFSKTIVQGWSIGLFTPLII